ncbi:MAG TPA: hypothetical protein VFG87_28030 [Amycolatopsis sp.]|jgi:hypothetical protein|nr:hypothetical protein [Amycolatopsis sp.]
MDVKAIRQGLATAAGTITTLRCYRTLPGAINPPAFAPVELEMAYHNTFSNARGLTDVTFTCGVYVPDTDQGSDLLDGFMAETGAGSVAAALEADKTLGGVAKTLIVQKVRGVGRLYDVGDTQYLGGMIDVRVWA